MTEPSENPIRSLQLALSRPPHRFWLSIELRKLFLKQHETALGFVVGLPLAISASAFRYRHFETPPPEIQKGRFKIVKSRAISHFRRLSGVNRLDRRHMQTRGNSDLQDRSEKVLAIRRNSILRSSNLRPGSLTCRVAHDLDLSCSSRVGVKAFWPDCQVDSRPLLLL